MFFRRKKNEKKIFLKWEQVKSDEYLVLWMAMDIINFSTSSVHYKTFEEFIDSTPLTRDLNMLSIVRRELQIEHREMTNEHCEMTNEHRKLTKEHREMTKEHRKLTKEHRELKDLKPKKMAKEFAIHTSQAALLFIIRKMHFE